MRLGGVAVALAALALAGCARQLADVDHDGTIRIVVLGDSNTAKGWPAPDTVRWVQMAQGMGSSWRSLPVAWTEVAVGGATVCDIGDGWMWAGLQLGFAMKQHPDGIILAFGTNDLRRGRKTPAEIVACYRGMIDRIPRPLPVWIALTPPLYQKDGAPTPEVERIDDALRAAFPAAQVIDFWTGFGPDLYAGLDAWNTDALVHLNDAGQRLRARRAVDAVLGESPQGRTAP